MRHIAPVRSSRIALRLALIGATAGLLAGCAGSERLADPFSNPFQTSQAGTDPAPTASINPAAPVAPVQSRPLAAPTQYQPPTVPQAPRLAAAAPLSQAMAGWSAAGGTPIQVAQGESADVLATRYGVPKDALLKANGLSSAAQVQAGTRLVIPVYNAAGPARVAQAASAPTAPTAPAAPLRKPAEAHAEKIRLLKGAAGTNVAGAKAETARTEVAKAEAAKPEIARAPSAKPEKSAALTHPAEKTAAAKVAAEKVAQAEAPVKKAVAVKAEATPAQPVKTAPAQPVKTALLTKQETAKPDSPKQAAPTPEATKAEAENEAGADAKGDANPEFRWPARGRIIQSFKPGGNDGINIAVPEGTSVKAAESGVVAYAGNELKGYGNLILIRHPNGFVSAYANNGDIEVKRGETVKRGQIIAKSGQSGNVASPQLHFELRKGATPVDPTLYLAGL